MSTLLLIIFNNTTTTEIYTLSLHDALPIYDGAAHRGERVVTVEAVLRQEAPWAPAGHVVSRGQWAEPARSEEHTSELQSRGHLVCRLLLEKKKNDNSVQSCTD